MKMKSVLACLVIFAAVCASAVEWRNVDAAHYLGGRKASAGYLQGKVVLVCLWQADDVQSVGELLSSLEEVWTNFKTKPLVVLGGPLGGADEAVKRQLDAAKISFPVYSGAALSRNQPIYKSLPFLYVVDETGKVVYLGHDDRNATQAVVSALTDLESPKNVKQWRRFLDYELNHLPCRGFLRLREFRKKFPEEVRDYEPKAKELLAIPNLKKVAELVEFAKKAKDPPVFRPEEKEKRAKYCELVEGVISSCEVFKEHPDPRVAQEAKNALADLKWTQATF